MRARRAIKIICEEQDEAASRIQNFSLRALASSSFYHFSQPHPLLRSCFSPFIFLFLHRNSAGIIRQRSFSGVTTSDIIFLKDKKSYTCKGIWAGNKKITTTLILYLKQQRRLTLIRFNALKLLALRYKSRGFLTSKYTVLLCFVRIRSGLYKKTKNYTFYLP